MAALREIPFDLYYGSIDATPLFVMLAGAYLQHTHELEFIRSIWPQIDLALRWMNDYGDSDGARMLESARTSPKGLVQPGSKDSLDSVIHRDDTVAQGTIALCDNQGSAPAAILPS